MGGVLLYLAVPRTVASWTGLGAQSAIEKLQGGKAPSDVELREGIAGLRRAIAWVATGRRLTDLAMLELEQAVRLPESDPAREGLLAGAERDLVAGLAADPVNGFAWMRLAIVRELRGASARDVAAALVQSLDMAPNMRKLWFPRAVMCLRYWREFSFEELLSLRAQLRTMWAADHAMRRPLLQTAGQTGELAVVSWALSDVPPSRAEAERLKETPPRPLRLE